MDKLITWGAIAAPYFIAIPIAIFGAQHFIYLQFVADFIPAWIPWRTFWACFTGVALMSAAVGIVFRLWNRQAATWLGTMIFLWVVLLHTSRIAAKPTDFGEWRGIFQALSMSGCAFALAGFLRQQRQPQDVRESVPALDGRLAPWFIGVAMTALGAEHYIFATDANAQVPLWLPANAPSNYLCGTVLILLGVGICIPRTRRNASALLGLAILLSMLFVHLPIALRSTHFESDWTKTFMMSAGAFLLAAISERRSPVPAESVPVLAR
ncbi:MAG TPA: hypothetical protein VMF06_17870 [Candidatus Limnocylindria bacterium]|nr:hypothetical protein [Candidatus Limnocylindria bacterium]